MDTSAPTLENLFAQLNLESTPQDIDAFITAHPLEPEMKLIEAPFWTPVQAAFLKEQLRNDAEWAIPVDELNQRLHQKR